MRRELVTLEKVVKVLNDNNIHFWMYGGALASYIKINDLFAWDGDIDLFIWKEDFPKLVSIKDEFGLKYIFKEYTLALKGEEESWDIDIMYFDKFDRYIGPKDRWSFNCSKVAFFERLDVTNTKFGRILYFGFLNEAVKHKWMKEARFFRWVISKLPKTRIVLQEVPAHFFENLKEIDFFGIKLKVPRDHEAFMDYTYGPFWRLPIEEQKKYEVPYKREGRCNPNYYQVIK
jgi:phosphorylcholine metabolism protein LicD